MVNVGFLYQIPFLARRSILEHILQAQPRFLRKNVATLGQHENRVGPNNQIFKRMSWNFISICFRNKEGKQKIFHNHCIKYLRSGGAPGLASTSLVHPWCIRSQHVMIKTWYEIGADLVGSTRKRTKIYRTLRQYYILVLQRCRFWVLPCRASLSHARKHVFGMLVKQT